MQPAPYFAQHLKTAHPGQHDIEQQQIRVLAIGLLERFPSVKSGRDRKALMLQLQLHDVGKLLVVFYNEDFRHACSFAEYMKNDPERSSRSSASFAALPS